MNERTIRDEYQQQQKIRKVVNNLNQINVIRRDKIFSVLSISNVWINLELANGDGDGDEEKRGEKKCDKHHSRW